MSLTLFRLLTHCSLAAFYRPISDLDNQPGTDLAVSLHHDRLGRIRPPPPAISRTNGRIEPVRKLYKIIPKHTQDLRLILKSRVKVRPNVKFWCFCMTRPGIGDIDNFCLKLSQVSSKGWWMTPMSISARLSTGQGQGQITKGHQNQFFSGMRHMINNHFGT